MHVYIYMHVSTTCTCACSCVLQLVYLTISRLHGSGAAPEPRAAAEDTMNPSTSSTILATIPWQRENKIKTMCNFK